MTCAVVAGALVAVAALPAALAGGLLAKAGADAFQDLPSTLPATPPAQATEVYARDGTTLITEFYDEYRRDVPLSGVAPVMRQAMVAAEDTRFYQHGGIDLRSVLRALVSNGSSGEVE